MYQLLYKTPKEPILPTLRLMSGGGAAKPPEVHYEVRDEIGGTGVVHGYGMTEVPMISNGSPTTPTSSWRTPTASRSGGGRAHRDAGRPGAGSGRGGRGAGEGGDGLPRLHGPALDAEAFDDDGYFRTGDLGRLRADGHLDLTGRLKDVIVRKGENISAKEIEDLLYTHPDVAEVAVIGLARSGTGASGSAPSCSWPRVPTASSCPTWSRSAATPG